MTNFFRGESIMSHCVREWDRLLREQEWVCTDVFASIFEYETLAGEKILAYEKAIKKAKKEIYIELAKRGMSLREQKDAQDKRRTLTAYPSYNKDPLHDLRIMAIIEDAMIYKRALLLTYSPSYHEKEEHVFHAQYQRIYNGRLFVYGVYEVIEENRGFPFMALAVDRIMDARRIKDVPYRECSPIFHEEKMKNVLGASPNFTNTKVNEIVLRTHDPKVHKLLLTRPLHHSIRELQLCTNQQTGILTLQLQITQELLNWILHYGIGVEVVSPTELRNHIANIINTIHSYYNK